MLSRLKDGSSCMDVFVLRRRYKGLLQIYATLLRMAQARIEGH